MTVLSIKSMLDIDRFRKINIHAQQPGEVYAGDNLAPTCNVEFLKRCARLIPIINFADCATGQAMPGWNTKPGSGATSSGSPRRSLTPTPKLVSRRSLQVSTI